MSDIIGNEAVLVDRLAGLKRKSMEPSSASTQRKTLREWIATCTTESRCKPEHPLGNVTKRLLFSLDSLVELGSQARSEDWNQDFGEAWSQVWDGIETLLKRLERLDNEARDRCMAGIDHLFPLSQTVDGTSEQYLDHIMEAADSQRDAAFTADSVLEQAKSDYELALKIQLEAVSHGLPAILIKDFTRGLLGSGVQNLDHRIRALEGKVDNDGIQSTRNIYARVLAILQSSGSGKSRTTLGLMEHRLGMLVCVRGTASKKASWQSLPHSDDSVFKAIVPEIATSARVSGDHHLIAGTVILARWLEAFAEQFTKFTAFNKAAHKGTSNQVETSTFVAYQAAQLLNDIVPGFRTGNSPKNSGFLNAGVKTPRAQVLDDIDRCFEKSEQDWKDHVRRGGPVENEKGDKDDDRPSGEGDLLVCTQICATRLQPLFIKLTDLLDGDDQYMFLAIDEASSLGERLPLLRRLLSYMKVPRFWVLLMDTNNQVSELSGVDAVDASARLKDESLRLPQPFFRLPHDLYLLKSPGSQRVLDYNALLYKGKKSFTFSDMLSLLPLMGRPLWADNWLKSNPEVQVGGVSLWLVFAKLLNATSSPVWFTEGNVPRYKPENDLPLMMACWRLPLVLTGSQGITPGSSFQERQIANHLRWLTDMHTSLPILKSLVASEPIVSLAVTYAFRRNPSMFWSSALERISKEAVANQLNIGEAGEEFTRMVCTLALDLSVLSNSARKAPPRGVKLKPHVPEHLDLISVELWLKTLIEPTTFNGFPIQFRNWAGRHWLNFTHWIRLNKQYTADDAMPHSIVVQTWTRQTAILGIINQPTWDGLLPSYDSIYRPRADEVFDPSKVSPIAIQVRSRKNHNPNLPKWSRDSMPSVAAQPKPGAKMNLYFSLRGRTAVAYTLNEEGDHCIYFGGHSAGTFPVLDRLEPTGRSALMTLIGVFDDLPDESYMTDDGQYADPQMENLLDGALMIPDER